jgi:hypothetical protein
LIFGRRNDREGAVAVVRDIVEIVAIVTAGIWAFYIFAYENRIKPSWATPEVNFAATMQRIGSHNGLTAVRLHQEMQNIGTVPAYFLGLAVNVYGERVTKPPRRNQPPLPGTNYKYGAYFLRSAADPVYSQAYVTRLGDPSSTQTTELDPGDKLANDYTFYVPVGRYDLLTIEINGIFTKFPDAVIPTRLVRSGGGAVTLVTADTSRTTQYDTNPVTTLALSE